MFKPTNIKDHERLFNREIKRWNDSIKQLVRFIFSQHEGGGNLSEANHERRANDLNESGRNVRRQGREEIVSRMTHARGCG